MLAESAAFNTAVFSALAACLGVSGAAANALIHPANDETENMPRPPRSRDIVYYYVTQEIDEEDLAQTFVTKSTKLNDGRVAAVRSFLAYQLIVICYGPHAETNAHRIRSLIFLDGSGKARTILRKAGIYPIPNPSQPVLTSEPEGSLWRSRADQTISIRVADELSTTFPTVRVPPTVQIYSRH